MTEATRDEVLQWMEDEGQGPAAAARHFGLKPATVRSWKRRHGATASKAQRKAQRSAQRSKRKAPKTTPDPPAQDKKPRAKGRKGRTPPKKIDPSLLGRATAAKLKRAIVIRAAWLADPANLGHKSQSAVAVSLGILTDKYAQVVATIDPDAGNGPNDTADNMDRVLGALGIADDDTQAKPVPSGADRRAD